MAFFAEINMCSNLILEESDMNLIEKALIFAAKAHDNQYRKGTKIPYITHPVAVGMLLHNEQCSDEVIAAGILHDTIEDTNTTLDELVTEFGQEVAELVLAASETDRDLSWEERKHRTIKLISSALIEEIQVITADKLHNVKSIRRDLIVYGDKLWDRFNRGKEHQQWYYTSIVKAVAGRKSEFPLINTLEQEVISTFGSTEVPTGLVTF